MASHFETEAWGTSEIAYLHSCWPDKWKRSIHKGGSRGEGTGGAHPPPSPPLSEMTCGFLIQLVFYSAKKMVVYWCWSKKWDEVEEFMLNPVKMVVPGSVPDTGLHRFYTTYYNKRIFCRQTAMNLNTRHCSVRGLCFARLDECTSTERRGGFINFFHRYFTKP